MSAVVIYIDEAYGAKITMDLNTDNVGGCQRDLGPVVGGDGGVDEGDHTGGHSLFTMARWVHHEPMRGGPGLFLKVHVGLLE